MTGSDQAAALREAAERLDGYSKTKPPSSPDTFAAGARWAVVSLHRMAGEAQQLQACDVREPEPRTGTSPCVLPAGHGGDTHQDKWTNQWPAAKGMAIDLFTGPEWETRDPEAEGREREIQREA